MRFRVTHLFLAMLVIALLGTALAIPSDVSVSVVNLGAWFVYAVLVARAIARPAERPVLISAVIFGLSYLLLVAFFENDLVTELLLERIGYGMELNRFPTGPNQWNNYVHNFTHIGQLGFSFLFAFIGGALAAYWSRPRAN